MEISREGFFNYMLQTLSEGSAKSYISYISSVKPEGYESVLNGRNLLDYICDTINDNEEADFARIFLLQVQEDVIDTKGINERTLRNCLSAMRKFLQYVDYAQSEADDLFEDEDKEDKTPVTASASDTSEIKWFEIEKKYQDKRITPSQKMSVKGNFKSRLGTQSRKGGLSIPFPIKMIRSVFTNAAKYSGVTNPATVAKIQILKLDIDTIIDTLADRVLFYTKDETPSDEALWSLRIPTGMWGYTLCSLKAIGFDGKGKFYIKLNRPQNNVLMAYTCDFTNNKTWKPMDAVFTLKDIELDHDPTADDILKHCKDDFTALPFFNKIMAQHNIKEVSDFKNNSVVWNQLNTILERLAYEVKIILSYYNLDALQRDSNRNKQTHKTKACNQTK